MRVRVRNGRDPSLCRLDGHRQRERSRPRRAHLHRPNKRFARWLHLVPPRSDRSMSPPVQRVPSTATPSSRLDLGLVGFLAILTTITVASYFVTALLPTSASTCLPAI